MPCPGGTGRSLGLNAVLSFSTPFEAIDGSSLGGAPGGIAGRTELAVPPVPLAGRTAGSVPLSHDGTLELRDGGRATGVLFGYGGSSSAAARTTVGTSAGSSGRGGSSTAP